MHPWAQRYDDNGEQRPEKERKRAPQRTRIDAPPLKRRCGISGKMMVGGSEKILWSSK